MPYNKRENTKRIVPRNSPQIPEEGDITTVAGITYRVTETKYGHIFQVIKVEPSEELYKENNQKNQKNKEENKEE